MICHWLDFVDQLKHILKNCDNYEKNSDFKPKLTYIYEQQKK